MVKQLCWEKELHDIHSSNDFRLVNGKLLCPFQFLENLDYLRRALNSMLCGCSHAKLIEWLQLIIEGGTAIAIFVRCFADKKGIERELAKKLDTRFPRGVLATISVKLAKPLINFSLQSFGCKFTTY